MIGKNRRFNNFVYYSHLLGINFTNQEELLTLSQRIKGHCLFTVLLVNLVFSGNFCVHNKDNLGLLTGGITIFIQALLTSLKAFVYTNKKLDLFLLIKEINDLKDLGENLCDAKWFEDECRFLPISDLIDRNAKKLIKSTKQNLNLIFTLYYFSGFATFFAFAAAPTCDFLWQEHYQQNSTRKNKRYVPMNFK